MLLFLFSLGCAPCILSGKPTDTTTDTRRAGSSKQQAALIHVIFHAFPKGLGCPARQERTNSQGGRKCVSRHKRPLEDQAYTRTGRFVQRLSGSVSFRRFSSHHRRGWNEIVVGPPGGIQAKKGTQKNRPKRTQSWKKKLSSFARDDGLISSLACRFPREYYPRHCKKRHKT